MSKGKIKELLFDVNSNEFVELDEKGKPVKKPKEKSNSNDESSHELGDSKAEEILLDTKEIVEESSEEAESEDWQILSEGKEKLEEMVTIGADKADKAYRSVKKGAQKGAKKTSEAIKHAAKSSKPHVNNAKEKIQQGLKKAGQGLKKWTDNAKQSLKNGGIKQFAKDNKMTLALAFMVIILGGGIYTYNYFKLPTLGETHAKNSGNQNHETYDAEVHPMQLLSTTRENMVDYKGAPTEKGDGKQADSKYVVYSLEWFGNRRKTILFYNNNNQFKKIKLEIGNEGAKSIYDKLNIELGKPIEDKNPTVKGGYAIWVKDAVRYKMIHRGSYSTIEMSLATYDNAAGLKLGKFPIVIQDLRYIDLNKDQKIDEKIMLLGNRPDSVTTNFEKLYLLVWDGKKTHLMEMDPEFDGGSFPQLDIADVDGDKKEELVVSSENNIVKQYNVFKNTGSGFEKTYSGYNEPKGVNEQ